MADEEQDGEEDRKASDAVASSSARKSFSRRLFPYFAGGAVSLGLGVGAGIAQIRKDEAKPGEESAEKKRAATPAEYPVELKLDLGKTIFNCADNGQLIAGAVTILLEVRTNEKWGSGEKPKLKDAIDPKSEGEYSCAGRIKDALVILLSTKMSGDLRSSRGKEVLKLEILDQMNRILFGGLDREKDPRGVVTNVLFTDFLVQ
jgi:flagellar basal body-associated protein FliL